MTSPSMGPRRSHDLAQSHGVSQAQFSLAWPRGKPWVTAPLIDAANVRQLDDAAAALMWKLAAEDTAQLEQSYVPYAGRCELARLLHWQ